jgi:hypothetical protein
MGSSVRGCVTLDLGKPKEIRESQLAAVDKTRMTNPVWMANQNRMNSAGLNGWVVTEFLTPQTRNFSIPF